MARRWSTGKAAYDFVRLARPARNGVENIAERTLFSTVNQKRDRPPDRPVGLPHSGPDTSREAAKRIVPVASVQAVRVFQAIAAAGPDGRTDHELQAELNMTGDSERPRRWSLQNAGLIRDSGRRRQSPAGRKAIVWECVSES